MPTLKRSDQNVLGEITVRFSGCTRTLKGEGRKRPRTGHAKRGGVAQLGEHLLCKQGVVGSNPFISTKDREDPKKKAKCPNENRDGLIAQLVRARA